MSTLTMDMLLAAITKPLLPRGPRIIENLSVYKISFRVRGFPASRKPNRNRPYYRNVRIIEYPILYIKSENVILCHPIMANKIRRNALEAKP